MRSFYALPPLSLYVHLPWCIRKCPYCDFNSHAQTDTLPEQEYVDALLADLTEEIPRFWGRSLVSVFIGGGTPSLFSASALEKLLSGIRALTALAPTAEITLEANPGTVEQAKFRDFFQIGINRLSIGVQSFDDLALNRLGRVHNAREALRAVHIAQRAGFTDINLDLMFGLPGQSEKQAQSDLLQALALNPTHISYYELTLEPNTLFARYPPALPPEDSRWEMQQWAINALAQAGFERYEISAYAKDRYQARHNRNYWLYGDYIGIGAGAHGKLSFADSGKIIRRWKHRHPQNYMTATATGTHIGGDTVVPIVETAMEFMLNALRLCDGFPAALFQTHTGLPLHVWQKQIDAAVAADLLIVDSHKIRPSERGLNFLNDLLEHFMPTQNSRYHPVIPQIPD